jgi:hypothetical protein
MFAALPTYRMGQHVVRVSVGSGVEKSAGSSLPTTRREITIHFMRRAGAVSVVISSPTCNAPIRLKCRSRCAEMTEFPRSPGRTLPGR